MGPGAPAPPGRPSPRLRGRWDFPRLRMPMGRRQGPGRGALERSEPSHLGGAVCGTGWGRPLPRQAARAMRLGRFAPLALRLQGRTPGELCRNLVGSSAERYLCPSHRLAGDTALVLGTRGAPSGRAFALLARLRSGSRRSRRQSPARRRAPGSYLLSHFFCKAARERDVITPIFLSTCFARNCLSGESYIFLLLYLALSLNWSLFLAVLIAISLH